MTAALDTLLGGDDGIGLRPYRRDLEALPSVRCR